MKVDVPEEMDYHALNAMLYIQACAKLSPSDCMKEMDLLLFMINLIDSYPREWEFFCYMINTRPPNDY